MKYVTYFRVSTQRQGRSGLGLEAQRNLVDGYLAAHPGEVIASFTEVESGKKNNRPKMLEALALCRTEDATLIIAKLDRLSRNAAFLLNLRDSGARFIAADMPEANTLTIGIMALMAQQEREFISTRTQQALAARKAKGLACGGRRENGFGDGNGASGREANKAHAQARADKLSTLLNSFKTQGMSLRQIAEQLNALEIKTARGGSWHASSVKNYLDRV